MAFGKSHRDPYGTSVGHLVEKATFAGVQTEDWGQFMHICDIINTTQDGPKDAVKALKKRISKNYNHKEIQLSLSLIDMCMQNCGPSFQSLIVKKEFIKDTLVKLLNPRYTLPLDIQNRILNFIKTWSQGFPGGVDVSEVKEVYLDLLKKGVQFPPSAAEAETRQEAAQLSPKRPTPVPTAPALSSIIAPKNPTISLVPEQIGKLHSELDMVKMNVKVMTAILMENIPGSENHEDIELLQGIWYVPPNGHDVHVGDHWSRWSSEKMRTNSKELCVEGVVTTLAPLAEVDTSNIKTMSSPLPPINCQYAQFVEPHQKPVAIEGLMMQPTEQKKKLYKTGREMQERIMDLLVVVENEDVTVELIQVNEDLNNAILGYERFTRNQQRLLEQNRNPEEATNTSNEPSAPSCDLLDLSPILPTPMSNGDVLNSVNAQLSGLSVSSPSPVITNNLYPRLHPQVDLLASENTETPTLFAQRTSQNLASSHTYDNFLEHSNSVLLQPQTATAAPSSQRPPLLPSNHPVLTNNDLQPPNYYEVMEFDPLAPATEAVYEEIDAYHHKGDQSHSDC